MVKRREPPVVSQTKEPTPEEIEAFAAAVDGGAKRPTTPEPKAKRDYKAIRVPFNEYEFEQLEVLANKTGRSKLNAIRWAILKMAEDVQK